MTDRSFALFEPDTLVPAQFYAAFRGSSGAQGARRLMLAVLQDALDCYQKYAFARDVYGKQLFDEAHAWIAAREHGWHFSFENICDTLNLFLTRDSPRRHEDTERQGLLRTTRSASREHSAWETMPPGTQSAKPVRAVLRVSVPPW